MAEKECFHIHPRVPLSRAVKAGPLLFLSGDASLGYETGETVPGDIRKQTRQTLENLKRTLEYVGSSLDKVVKATVFMTDITQFGAMNEEYRAFFPENPPARSTVEVSRLAREELLIEIELVALA